GGPTFGDAARAVGVRAPARVLELSVGDGVVVCDGPVEVEVLLAGEVGDDRAAAHGACALHLVPPPTLSVRVYGSSVSDSVYRRKSPAQMGRRRNVNSERSSSATAGCRRANPRRRIVTVSHTPSTHT